MNSNIKGYKWYKPLLYSVCGISMVILDRLINEPNEYTTLSGVGIWLVGLAFVVALHRLVRPNYPSDYVVIKYLGANLTIMSVITIASTLIMAKLTGGIMTASMCVGAGFFALGLSLMITGADKLSEQQIGDCKIAIKDNRFFSEYYTATKGTRLYISFAITAAILFALTVYSEEAYSLLFLLVGF